jgi:hypothetical protein
MEGGVANGKDPELKLFLAERDRLFLNPNPVDALAWWHKYTAEAPTDARVPLAAVHKARLQWLDATDTMLAESKRWLEANEFGVDWQGAPPLSPDQRDIDRARVGKPPLSQVARYPNGQPMFDDDGMMLDKKGNRSIFDDVDE